VATLDQHCSVSNHRKHAAGIDKYPLLSPPDIHFITYHDLVGDTSGTVQGITDFLETPFNEAALGDWFANGETCSVGGNNAAFAQKTENEMFFTNDSENPKVDYLDGKYHGQYQKIFMDESWRGKTEFFKVALQQYEALKEPMSRLAPVLGHGDHAAFLEDLKS